MEREEIIYQYNQLIREIYKEENLQCLRGLNNKFILRDKQILIWYHDVIRKCNIKNTGSFDYFKNIDTIILCSDEIMYFTAQLFLYRPFLNDPISDSHEVNGHRVYPNIENLEAKRYYIFADVISEKLYNFWDKIGDLIASFFPELIDSKSVYFDRVFDIIPNKFQSMESYIWLQEFRQTEYKILNSKRKQVVHYNSSNIEEKYHYLISSKKVEDIERWIFERNDLADYYKKQIGFTIDGFYTKMKNIADQIWWFAFFCLILVCNINPQYVTRINHINKRKYSRVEIAFKIIHSIFTA